MECRPPRWTRRRPPGRDAPSPDGHGCEDDDSDGANNNLGGVVRAAGTSSANDTTVLVDELEQLRTDNFQLRLRVYNAERRVDRLSAAAAAAASRSRDRSSGSSGGSDSDDDSDSDGEDDARAAAASAKATAEAAVRTVHDLLTVNRRLLALLAAAVSAKAVAVTGRDKRRWQKLRNRLRDCGGAGARIEEEPENSDGGSDGTSSADSETRAAEATTRRRTPPRTPEEPDRAAAADGDDDDDDELARLRARCRRLERSLQQLVNTELWARNRQIGKLEQQRYGTQARCPQADRPRPVAAPDAAGRTPVDKSPTPPPPPDALSAKDAIATPPPVLPDYSEVNFFYSCDDDDDDDQENGSGTDATGLSSTGGEDEEKTATDDDGPVKPRTETTAVGRFRTPLATSTPPAVVRPRKRPKRRRIRDAATPPSSVTAACDPSDDGRATSPPRRHRIVAYRRRRRGQARRCSTCGDVVDRDGGGRVDAQVQCGVAEELDDPQVGLLRRELEARRRENGRLYDMLLRLQRSEAVSPVRLLGDDDDDDDNDDSPEPYRRAARAVRGRIADLLPPLLSAARPDDGRCAAPTPTPRDRRDADDDEQQTPLRQQQQQLLLLARLRERIVAYERQELHGGPLNAATADLPATADLQENAVERMDRAALVNVALPRAVDRLRRALVPLLQHKRQRDASPRRVETAVAAELE